MMKPEKYYIGDACLCWSVGDTIDPVLSATVLDVYRRLKTIVKEMDGVYDLVPSYNAIAIHFDPLNCDITVLEKEVDDSFEAPSGKEIVAGDDITIPVMYQGPDLELMAEMHGLSIREVVDIHKEATYTVAMVGFKPHFPYLIGLDKRIETPRQKTPRLKVPAGAVAVGGAQTGIYPVESPGGWNLIGMTDPELLKTIQPGDTIHFKEVERL